MEAKSLVLMNKKNGILEEELGSYEIEDGLEYIFKAYVEDGIVKLFLTTDRDVSDEEYNEVFDMYDGSFTGEEGFEIEEVEEEYNPVWSVSFEFDGDYDKVKEKLNYIIKKHKNEIDEIMKSINSK